PNASNFSCESQTSLTRRLEHVEIREDASLAPVAPPGPRRLPAFPRGLAADLANLVNAQLVEPLALGAAAISRRSDGATRTRRRRPRSRLAVSQSSDRAACGDGQARRRRLLRRCSANWHSVVPAAC